MYSSSMSLYGNKNSSYRLGVASHAANPGIAEAEAGGALS